MVQIIADKGAQGVTMILETGDVNIMTWQQVSSSTANASEINGNTIAPVPVGKTLYITNVTMYGVPTADLQFFNSPNSGSQTGATQIGQNYVTGSAGNTATVVAMPVFWKIDAGRYFVVKEGGGGQGQIHCRGVLA